jgi:signal transduction histidine kinase
MEQIVLDDHLFHSASADLLSYIEIEPILPMPPFRSIRWRLVAGFTLLTLLTVTLLGVLVLSLMQRYVARQEIAFLQANATALAQQSEPFLTAPARRPALISLAQTAALLGNFDVRILDANEEVVVDSAAPVARAPITWLPAEPGHLPPVAAALWRERVARAGDIDVFVVNSDGISIDRQAQGAPLTDLPAPRLFRIIRQNRDAWGPVLHFDMTDDAAPPPAVTIAAPFTGTLAIPAPPLITVTAAGDVLGASGTTQPRFSFFRNRPLAALLARLWTRPAPQQVITPIQQATDVVGYVELRSTPGVAAQALIELRRLFLLAAAGVSVAAVALGLVMSRSLTAPLQALTTATGAMNAGDLSARVAVQGDDEIGQLAHSFNRMADALETSFADLAAERDALRHFVADASHELRTPITALRTFNELLQEAAAGDPAAQAEFLAESGLQVQRLERITESLLNLSRFDGGLVELDLADVPVAELIDTVVALLRPLAVERSVLLSAAPVATGLTVRCDRQQMERALTNLLENALKFTPAGGRVHVGAGAGAGGVELWVEDTGIGIAPAEQMAIFRRFYRGQNATNGGSGLGLAIVQSIVLAHGGRVVVESVEGQGSRFSLQLSTD